MESSGETQRELETNMGMHEGSRIESNSPVSDGKWPNHNRGYPASPIHILPRGMSSIKPVEISNARKERITEQGAREQLTSYTVVRLERASPSQGIDEKFVCPSWAKMMSTRSTVRSEDAMECPKLVKYGTSKHTTLLPMSEKGGGNHFELTPEPPSISECDQESPFLVYEILTLLGISSAFIICVAHPMLEGESSVQVGGQWSMVNFARLNEDADLNSSSHCNTMWNCWQFAFLPRSSCFSSTLWPCIV